MRFYIQPGNKIGKANEVEKWHVKRRWIGKRE